jgi:hypothetical protein
VADATFTLDSPTDMSELPCIDLTGEEWKRDPYGSLRAARADSWIHQSDRGVEILRYEPQRALVRDRLVGQDHIRLAEAAGASVAGGGERDADFGAGIDDRLTNRRVS